MTTESVILVSTTQQTLWLSLSYMLNLHSQYNSYSAHEATLYIKLHYF